VAAGRITAGHGQFLNTCSCCRGNDDHACDRLTMGGAIAQHDKMRAVAYVRAGEDETLDAIWVNGLVAPDATPADLAALGRRKVSGDWREVAGAFELVEVLSLSRERPGFPLPRARMVDGQPRALVAAGTVRPRPAAADPAMPALDYDRLGSAVADALAARIPALGITVVDRDTVLAETVDALERGGAPVIAQLAAEVTGLVDGILADDRATTAAALIAQIHNV